jgi:hypothetical protein
VASVALACAALAPASAQAATAPGVAFGGTFVEGSSTGPVDGAFYLDGFSGGAGTVNATGTAFFSLCVPDVDPKNCLASFSERLRIPISTLAASCDELDLALGGVEIQEPPFTIDFDPVSVVIAGSSTKDRTILCALSHRLAAAGQSGNLVPVLDRLLAS